MILKCQHCKYEWGYNGTGKFLATCPRCHIKVRLVNTPTDIKKDGEINHVKELTESGRLGMGLMALTELLKRQDDDIKKLKDELESTRTTLFFLVAMSDINARPKPSGDAMDEVTKKVDTYTRIYKCALTGSGTSAETPVFTNTKLIKFPKLSFEEISNLQGDTA